MKDKSVLITGASSGIGAAIARSLAEAGASVALFARREEKLKEVVASLPEGTRALVIQGDVTDEKDVKRGIEKTVDTFGSLDVLINNAGYGLFKPVHEMTANEFDGMIAVNLRGVFLCTKYALERMYEQDRGSIVTISSLAGKQGFAGGGGYCASKFGVMGLMESVFHEARSRNVRVITIAPGSVDTHFFDEGRTTPPPNREKILQPEDVAVTVLHALSLPERALIRELDIRPANPR